MTLDVTTIADRDDWNNALRRLPYAHILQTWEWGEFKHATTGWMPLRLAFWRNGAIVAMASVGMRRLGPIKALYIPKGPALAYEDYQLTAAVMDYLEALARQQRAVWLKIDPDVINGTGAPDEPDATIDPIGEAFIRQLKDRGWRFSNDQVQFRNTIVLDLTQDEETLLAQMSQNTRRKIRVAEKRGVNIRKGNESDLHLLYELYRVTGQRDNFLIRPFDYYQLAWQTFISAGLAQPLIAEYEGRPIAHVILFHFGEKCWYFYGASADEERERMPNYALQWQAIRWAKQQGYRFYDMWGAPDNFTTTDSLWGVYMFKRGFRGLVTRHIGAWDYAPYPPLYTLYTQLWPRVLSWMRRRSKSPNDVKRQ